MPRLPKNLVRRNGTYVFRMQDAKGRDKRICLGTDRDLAGIIREE